MYFILFFYESHDILKKKKKSPLTIAGFASYNDEVTFILINHQTLAKKSLSNLTIITLFVLFFSFYFVEGGIVKPLLLNLNENL